MHIIYIKSDLILWVASLGSLLSCLKKTNHNKGGCYKLPTESQRKDCHKGELLLSSVELVEVIPTNFKCGP